MQYFRAYQSVFDNPKWMTNLLIGGLCQIVPVVGPIVWSGYLYESIEKMLRRGTDIYPDFDSNRLVPYLTRGLWVFLIGLIAGVIITPIFLVMYFGLFFVSLNADQPAILFLGMMCMLPVLIAIQAALMLALVPMSLRAGLSQDLGKAFDWAFIRDFTARAGKEVILGWLFVTVTAFLLIPLGLLLCFVGVYLVGALIGAAAAHVQFQAYQEYLSRGGETIPFKEETA